MVTNVYFCENNSSSQEIMNLLSNLPNEKKQNLNINTQPCLGHCGDCAQDAIALIDDQLYKGATSIKDKLGL